MAKDLDHARNDFEKLLVTARKCMEGQKILSDNTFFHSFGYTKNAAFIKHLEYFKEEIERILKET